MAHTHPVVDSDSRFVINSTTRAISTSSDKLELIQGDHQSERITFEISKIVEGHDMSLSDRIEVHYINIDRRTKATSRDIYITDDMAVDGDKLTFSWLISGNATKYYGRLNFIILFECLDPDGNYTYKWNTEICKLLTVGEGISNTAAVAEDYSDILEKFKIEVLGEATKDTVKFTEQELSDQEKAQARKNIHAASADIESKAVLSTEQSFTSREKAQALANIGGAPNVFGKAGDSLAIFEVVGSYDFGGQEHYVIGVTDIFIRTDVDYRVESNQYKIWFVVNDDGKLEIKSNDKILSFTLKKVQKF